MNSDPMSILDHHDPSRPPGSLVAPLGARSSDLSVIAFGPDAAVRETGVTVDRFLELRAAYPVVWANVYGVGTPEVIERLGRACHLHPLALEDVMNLKHRPKVERYEDHLFLIMRLFNEGDELSTEQVSMFLGDGFVITLQEHEGDCFDAIRARLELKTSPVRSAGADYLAYRLLDAVIDGYFPVLETYADRLESCDDQITVAPDDDLLKELHRIKLDLRRLRRTIWPQREAIEGLLREQHPLICAETTLHLRDSLDHALRITDLLGSYQDWSGDLTNFFMSSMSNRMNEIMRVLTVTAAIFIPLTFVAGVYGMNFDRGVSRFSMPELGWAWGYPVVMSLMGFGAIGMLIAFRRWGWLGEPRKSARDRS